MLIDQGSIAKRLAELRKTNRLSRQILADHSGISANTIKAWESDSTIEIRRVTLDKYLAAFAQFGCNATADWVLYGNDTPPYFKSDEVHHLRITHQDTVDIASIVELFAAGANLLYFLDTYERLAYLQFKWLPFLGAQWSNGKVITSTTPLVEVCKPDVYKICHSNFIRALEGEQTSFEYNVGNELHALATVHMIYLPVKRHKDKQVIGILGLLQQKNTTTQSHTITY